MQPWTSTSIRAVATELGVLAPPVSRDHRHTADGRASCSPDQSHVLRSWAADKHRVTVVVPDSTRPLPVGLVSSCLEALGDRQVAIAVAVGLHRPPTNDEWNRTPHLVEVRTCGLETTDTGGQKTCRVVGHHAGCEIAFNPAVVDTDGIVVIGAVELHQYAGFSGGIKAVAVGCASAETIAWIHRPALLRSPKLGVGMVDQNPFRQQLTTIVENLPPMFEIQGLARVDGRWEIFAGPAESAWQTAVAASDAFYRVEPAQAALVGVFGPKAQNLYQASRGVTQLALQHAAPVPSGAPIALLTEAPDGLGDGLGEQAFARAIARGRAALLAELAAASDDDRAGGGAQRAFIVAQTSARHPVGYVSLRESEALSNFGWRFLRSKEEILQFLGTDDVIRVPDPLHRLPRTV